MWRIKQARNGTGDLEALLKAGWEPFAVSDGSVIWLRKLGATLNPGDPRLEKR